MQANAQQLQDYGRELHAWEAAMHRKDEALRQRKLRRQRGEEDESDVREQGNAHYRAGEFEAALACYTRAIALTDGYVPTTMFGKRHGPCTFQPTFFSNQPPTTH